MVNLFSCPERHNFISTLDYSSLSLIITPKWLIRIRLAIRFFISSYLNHSVNELFEASCEPPVSPFGATRNSASYLCEFHHSFLMSLCSLAKGVQRYETFDSIKLFWYFFIEFFAFVSASFPFSSKAGANIDLYFFNHKNWATFFKKIIQFFFVPLHPKAGANIKAHKWKTNLLLKIKFKKNRWEYRSSIIN